MSIGLFDMKKCDCTEKNYTFAAFWVKTVLWTEKERSNVKVTSVERIKLYEVSYSSKQMRAIQSAANCKRKGNLSIL